jgi:hypothetical protein
MALDLTLWANLNLVGSVGWQDYLSMTPEEAQACLKALNDVITESKRHSQRQADFDRHVERYRSGGSSH